MKSLVLSAFALLSSVMLFGQENELATIEITGQSQLSVMPDEVIFSVTVNQQNADFGVALDELNTKVNAIKAHLKKADVLNENMKTTNYSINENWKYENGKRYQDGYKAVHSLNIHIPFDKDRMKDIYSAIRDSKVEVNMRLSFGLSNAKKYEDKLMKMAMVDAKNKAEMLANSAEVEVIGIKNIDYGIRRNNYQPRNYNMQMDAGLAHSKSAATMDVNPGSIKLGDQVYVVFYIK